MSLEQSRLVIAIRPTCVRPTSDPALLPRKEQSHGLGVQPSQITSIFGPQPCSTGSSQALSSGCDKRLALAAAQERGRLQHIKHMFHGDGDHQNPFHQKSGTEPSMPSRSRAMCRNMPKRLILGNAQQALRLHLSKRRIPEEHDGTPFLPKIRAHAPTVIAQPSHVRKHAKTTPSGQ